MNSFSLIISALLLFSLSSCFDLNLNGDTQTNTESEKQTDTSTDEITDSATNDSTELNITDQDVSTYTCLSIYFPPNFTAELDDQSTVHFDATRPTDYGHPDCHSLDTQTYDWDFGDGRTQITTEPTISHNYLDGDTYNVTLTQTNSVGEQIIITKEVQANYSVACQIAYPNKISFTQNDNQITFSAEDINTPSADYCSTRPIDELRWDFGDGNTLISTEEIINHTYSAEGTYNVTVTAISGDISNTVTTDVTVDELLIHCTPGANQVTFEVFTNGIFVTLDASSSYISGCVGEAEISQYAWYFDDGTTFITHEMTNYGTHSVVLDVHGKSSYARIFTVAESVCSEQFPTYCINEKAPDLEIIIEPVSPNSNQFKFKVEYTGLNADQIDYTWRFSGEKYDEDSFIIGQETQVTFENDGLYTAMIYGQGPNDGVWATSQTFEINYEYCSFAPIAPPQAPSIKDFSNLFLTTNITLEDNNSICHDWIKNTWDFGDSNTLTTNDKKVTHHYLTTGTYQVNVSNEYGSTTETISIENFQNCIDIVSAVYFTQSNIYLEATFDGSSSYYAGCTQSYEFDEYHWDFGDGTTIITSSPFVTHQYKTSGYYDVTISDAMGLSYTNNTLIGGINCEDRFPNICYILSEGQVGGIFIVIKSDINQSHIKTFSVNYHGKYADQASYEWNIYKGNSIVSTSNENTFNATFESEGDYTVHVIGTGPDNNTWESSKVFEITSQP